MIELIIICFNLLGIAFCLYFFESIREQVCEFVYGSPKLDGGAYETAVASVFSIVWPFGLALYILRRFGQ